MLAFFAVELGAFGAHAWQSTLVANATHHIFSTASEYHFIHALALLWFGTYSKSLSPTTWVKYARYSMLIEIIIFSGSLYCLALTGIKWLGAITPIGGILLLSSWVSIAWIVY